MFTIKGILLSFVFIFWIVSPFSNSHAITTTSQGKPALPLSVPKADPLGVISLEVGEKKRPTTIVPSIQLSLKTYIRRHGNPIAAIVMVDVATGHIIAMAQGRAPEKWGGQSHTALYEGFPAASLFKVVPTIAAMDVAQLEPSTVLGLTGGCAKVHARGWWLRDVKPTRYHKMSLSRAFANSCNSFFAKLTLQYLGVGVLNSYAKKLGWNEGGIGADFHLNTSPMNPPKPARSAIHTVGRFAAGFGMVGLSPIHAAWINLVIARDGVPMALRIFADDSSNESVISKQRIKPVFHQENAINLRRMMQKTVRSGTASSAFRSWKYRKIKRSAGGKTGTLNSQAPKGLATWFAGLMPVENPKVVVSAVVVNGGRWIIKGSHLAAEGLRLWEEFQRKNRDIMVLGHSTNGTPSKG
ncbi:MAG: penicillin-binding transpeptidase domain-containing protein [Oligoflexales bacterium]